MPVAGAADSLLTTGVFANPNAFALLMSSATFLVLLEFGCFADHPHMVGASRLAGSTFMPRAALTCASVSREHGSAAGPPAYAGWQLHSIRAKKVPTIARTVSFEFMLSPPGNWLPTDLEGIASCASVCTHQNSVHAGFVQCERATISAARCKIDEILILVEEPEPRAGALARRGTVVDNFAGPRLEGVGLLLSELGNDARARCWMIGRDGVTYFDRKLVKGCREQRETVMPRSLLSACHNSVGSGPR